jgi:hypothetical protein
LPAGLIHGNVIGFTPTTHLDSGLLSPKIAALRRLRSLESLIAFNIFGNLT